MRRQRCKRPDEVFSLGKVCPEMPLVAAALQTPRLCKNQRAKLRDLLLGNMLVNKYGIPIWISKGDVGRTSRIGVNFAGKLHTRLQ